MTMQEQDSTDARILATALDHVRRYGYGRTTVVSVARDAGMSHANVYRYFPSKQALADALTAAWLKPLEAELAAIADAPDPADDKLERLLIAWASALREALEGDANLFEMFEEPPATCAASPASTAPGSARSSSASSRRDGGRHLRGEADGARGGARP